MDTLFEQTPPKAYTSELNPDQQAAVEAPFGHIQVLAGAGSGKTRVLVHRIAWLVATQGVSPAQVLAVTFTNKAATQMKIRIEESLGLSMGTLWVGTFHGLAHRLLRLHHSEAKLPQGFQIIDAEDQYRMVRRLLKELNLDEGRWPPKKMQGFINSCKEQGLRANAVNTDGDFHSETQQQVYQAYEAACEKAGIVDFAELLLRACELWDHHPEILQHYQQRFRHLLVDEFQDINTIQYRWLRALVTDINYLMVVGDDDQSIYGWRGAQVGIIRSFADDFANTTVVRLEQNYRSTATILNASNALIANNEERLGKDLWTDGEVGERIKLHAAMNEQEEAQLVVEEIRQWFNEHGEYKDIAVLYRSNAQSRVLEEALLQTGIPYRIYGGVRFFDRAEIKDALAYLRLMCNRNDDGAFERVVNWPTRGFGQRSLSVVADCAKTEHLSLWQAAKQIIDSDALSQRAKNSLASFIDLIDNLNETTKNLTLTEQVEEVVIASGLIEMFKQEKGEKGQSRVDNLKELISACREFNQANEEMEPLQAFLAQAVLDAGEAKSSELQDYVQLMTLHSAKGLEFPMVMIVGLEEGLFPHQMSSGTVSGLSEERRLCYVGMTRAMQQLVLSYAYTRRIYGRVNYHSPSRFLSEIPMQYVHKV